MIPTWLPPWLSGDLSLISGFLTWIVVLYWLWRSGWKIQRRYFIEATQKPLTRNAIVWSAGIVGAIFFVAAQMRPGMPGVMTVAMIGALSAYVDARTHRLPNAYTVAMAIGVVLGLAVGGVISPLWQERLFGALIGALIWFVPIALLNRLPGGMGGGDVKLGPVLGALVRGTARRRFCACALLCLRGRRGTVEDRCRFCGDEDPRPDGTLDDRISARRHYCMGCRSRLAVVISAGLIVDHGGTSTRADGTIGR